MRSWMKMMVGMAPWVVLGCDSTPPEPQPTREAEVEVEVEVEDLSARAPSRGRTRGGERMRRTVTWPASETRVVAAYDGLDGASRAAVDEAPVPVLVPALDVELQQRKVMRGPEWAAFWGQREGVTISLHASRMARVFPGVTPTPGTHTVRGREAFVTRNEGIWAASWIEHGVAYDLQLECVPLDAPTCADPDAIEALAEGLVFVGGRGEEVAR